MRRRDRHPRAPHDAFRAQFPFPYAVTYRPDLHNALIDACQADPLVELATAAKVTGFDTSDEKVIATVEDGGRIDGSALIGTDGLWSKVRETLVGDGPPRVSGHIAYRAILPAAEICPSISAATKSCFGRNHTRIWCNIRYGAAKSSTLSPSSTVTVTKRAGMYLGILTN
jgi:salicylate hydroxylase